MLGKFKDELQVQSSLLQYSHLGWISVSCLTALYGLSKGLSLSQELDDLYEPNGH